MRSFPSQPPIPPRRDLTDARSSNTPRPQAGKPLLNDRRSTR